MKRKKTECKLAKRARESRRRDKDPVDFAAKALLHRAIGRARKKKLEYNLDLEWVKDKLHSGRCEVTGIALDLRCIKKVKTRSSPYAPSLDRKDSSLGYTKDNCQITTLFYNNAKSDMDEREFRLVLTDTLHGIVVKDT